jgi:CheY-like chemotaxis protein
VLTDMMMPVKDGLATIQALKAINRLQNQAAKLIASPLFGRTVLSSVVG